MRSLGQNPTEAEIAELVARTAKPGIPGLDAASPDGTTGDACDLNDNGTIDFIEFLTLMASRCLYVYLICIAITQRNILVNSGRN